MIEQGNKEAIVEANEELEPGLALGVEGHCPNSNRIGQNLRGEDLFLHYNDFGEVKHLGGVLGLMRHLKQTGDLASLTEGGRLG